MRRSIHVILGIAVSAVFIYFLVIPGLHFNEVWQALKQANYWWIIPGILVYFIGLWARAWRWHYALRHLKSIPLTRLYPLICIGYFGNNVYPLRAGEFIRSYVLRNQEDIPFTSSLATVFIERIFDGLVMLLFVFLALPFAPLPLKYQAAVITLTVAFLAALGLFMWMAFRPTRIALAYQWVANRLLPQRLRTSTDDLYMRFMEGIGSLSSGTDIIMLFLTSVVIWLMETVKYWFVMHAFSFAVSFLVLMLMNGIVNIMTSLPASPGHLGTFDGPGIEVLTTYGIDKGIATSYTFTLHLALWVPVTIVGAYYFWRQELTWKDFSIAQQEAVAARYADNQSARQQQEDAE